MPWQCLFPRPLCLRIIGTCLLPVVSGHDSRWDKDEIAEACEIVQYIICICY